MSRPLSYRVVSDSQYSRLDSCVRDQVNALHWSIMFAKCSWLKCVALLLNVRGMVFA